MSCALFRSSAFTLAFLFLCGCGGSSGGNSGGGGGGGNPTTVTFTFTGAAPTAVATQIGSGAFTAASISSNALTLTLPSGATSFGAAYVCPPYSVDGSSLEINYQYVWEATTADGADYSMACPSEAPFPQLGALSVSVDATAIATVSLLYLDAQNGQFSSGAYFGATAINARMSAPVGSDRVDILAYNSPNPSGIQVNETLVAARSLDSQAVPGSLNGGVTVVLGAPDQTIPQPITYNNVPPGFTAPSSIASFIPGGEDYSIVLAQDATSQYPSMPTGTAWSGGTYVIDASSIPIAGGTGTGPVYAFAFLTSGAPVSFTFPAPWNYAGPTPAALPAVNMAYAGFPGTTGVSQVAWIDWGLGTDTQSQYQIMATANYQNGSTALSFPNLSGINGFLAPPASGSQVEWVAAILQSESGSIPTLPASESGKEVANSGIYTVP